MDTTSDERPVDAGEVELRIGRFGLDSYLLEREALARELCTWRLSATAFLAGRSLARIGTWGFSYTASTLTSKVGREVAGDKQLARSALRETGLPVPAGAAFSPRQLKPARRYARTIGYPVVVKPGTGRSGVGVATDLADDAAVEHAIAAVRETKYGQGRFVIEQQRPGRAYRVLVVSRRVVAVTLRDRPSIQGDGLHTVAQLLQAANHERDGNPYLRTRPLVLPDAFDGPSQQYRSDDVPAAGEEVELSRHSSSTTIGITRDVTDEMHPEVLALAVRAVDAIPALGHAGVDLLLEDHRASPSVQVSTILGVDASPELALHSYPVEGSPRPAADEVMRAHIGGTSRPRPFDHAFTAEITLIDTPAPSEWAKVVHRLCDGLKIDRRLVVEPTAVRALLTGNAREVMAVPALLAARRGLPAPEVFQTQPVPGGHQ